MGGRGKARRRVLLAHGHKVPSILPLGTRRVQRSKAGHSTYRSIALVHRREAPPSNLRTDHIIPYPLLVMMTVTAILLGRAGRRSGLLIIWRHGCLAGTSDRSIGPRGAPGPVSYRSRYGAKNGDRAMCRRCVEGYWEGGINGKSRGEGQRRVPEGPAWERMVLY